jgi:hypothetical protein
MITNRWIPLCIWAHLNGLNAHLAAKAASSTSTRQSMNQSHTRHENKKPKANKKNPLTQEEFESKRIEDSKYEKT